MRACKQVLINRDVVRPPPSASDGFDVSLIGDADVVTAHLAAAIGLSGTQFELKFREMWRIFCGILAYLTDIFDSPC